MKKKSSCLWDFTGHVYTVTYIKFSILLKYLKRFRDFLNVKTMLQTTYIEKMKGFLLPQEIISQKKP